MIYSNKHGDDDVLEIPPKLMEPPYSGFISITRTSRTALPRRIHGAAIYGVPWIPSTKTPVMLAYIPAPWILWVLQMINFGLPRVIHGYSLTFVDKSDILQ